MKIYSWIAHGTEIQSIEIQVHFRFQIPCFQILGLAGPEIQEARERIIAAFNSSGIEFPRKKVIVNLAPADLKKNGTGHDLAMALGVISKTIDFLSSANDGETVIYAWGELALDGKIVSCGKVASLLDLLCRDDRKKIVFLSPEDGRDLEELQQWRDEKGLKNPDRLELRLITELREILEPRSRSLKLPFRKVQTDQPELLPLLPHHERILNLAIIGRHHTLILGPKGIGKSQLLEWFRWLTPESDPSQTWQRLLYEDTSKHSHPLPRNFPMRSVHAQVKPNHLLGSWGNKGFRAGELSLAHGGILIADEFLEWHRDAKECLREPLQNKKTTLTRVQGVTRIECDFQLLATGNLCPCGGLPEGFRFSQTKQACRCKPRMVEEYLARLSGPIADRIDLIGILQDQPLSINVRFSSIGEKQLQERKEFLKKRIDFSLRNFGCLTSALSVGWLETHFPKSQELENILIERTSNLRSRHKAMRLARTIQACELSSTLEKEHLLEALSYRNYSTGVPQ